MKKYVNRCLLILHFSCMLLKVEAQVSNKKIDSLLSVLQTATDDSNKVKGLNELGWYMRISGNIEKGIEHELKAISLSQKLHYKTGEGKAYGNLGLMYADLGKITEAKKSHNNALQIRVSIGDKSGTGNSYTNIGHLYFDEGRFDSALFMYQKCLEIRKETKDDYGLGDSYNNISNVYKIQGNMSLALKYAVDALAIRKKINDLNGIAASHGNIGNIYWEQSNFADALVSYTTAVKIANNIGDKSISINALTGIGNVYSKQGNLSESLKNHLAALILSEGMGNKRKISLVADNAGIIYATQKNYAEAKKFYQKAFDINNELKDTYAQVYNFTNFGNLYYEEANALLKNNKEKELISKKFDTAFNYYKDVLKLSKEIGDLRGTAMSYLNLGLIYRKKENYKEALKNDSLALTLFVSIGEKYGIALTYGALADVHINLGSETKSTPNFNLALLYLKKSLTIAKEIHSVELISNVYESYSETYKSLENYGEAFLYAKLYYNTKDSLLNNDIRNQLEGVRIKYEIEKAQLDEKALQEKIQSAMQFAFSKREDSLNYKQILTGEKLKQQTLYAKQQEQALLLKQVSLDLSNKENEINRLAFLNTQAELRTEQSQRQEKEKQLTIAEQEKKLQAGQLQLQQTEITLKENQLQAQRRQRYFYIGGLGLMLLLFVFIYSNIKSRQKANSIIAAERLKAEKAESGHKMAELELQSLRTQLNPHFMFNSLNAIQELILMEDTDNSHIYLSRFSELLRMLLDNANQPFVPLRKEIMLLELYLSLEKLRIPDLEYSFAIDPAIDTERTMIPNMILQPYIENAIWHGLSHKKEDKKLNIRVTRDNEILHVDIEDNGVGRKKAHEMKSLYRKEHTSKGMELLSKRFNLLSKEYSLDIQSRITDLTKDGETGSGTLVVITMPINLTEKYNQAIYDQGYNN